MKKYKLLLMFLIFVNRLSAQIDPKDLLLHLPFDGNADDVSGNHYSGIVNGAVPDKGINNQPNTAYYFNGIDNSVIIPNITALDGQIKAFTILIRMMPMDIKPQPDISDPYAATYNFLTWHRNSADSLNAFLNSKMRIAWQPPSKGSEPHKAFLSYVMDWCSGNTGTASGYQKDSALVDHKWITVAFVYSEGTMKVFHNCHAENDWENTYPVVSDLCGSDPIQISIGNVPQRAFAYGYRYYKGKIDDLQIYKRALSDDEVMQYADSTCKEEIIPVVNAAIMATPDSCKPYHYIFTDHSATKDFITKQRKWVVDNNDSIEKDSLDYVFTTTGNHTVQLILQGSDTSFSATTMIEIESLKPLRFLTTASHEINVCEKKGLQLDVSGGKSYNWQPCLYLSDCSIRNPIVTTTDSVLYTVQAISADGCIDSIQIKVQPVPDDAQIYVPTAFTPNGDGHNDLFGALSFRSVTNCYFSVYNNFGEVVFSANDIHKKWNGKFKNIDQSSGTYAWTFQYQSGNGCSIKKKSGTVQIIR